ncbi:MAG: DegQ family serine endoprotease [Pseudomonadales bacterium]|nr:DegQ family serine endoprotease [Pseudomonadales bacterium]MCP5182804.1 DegQ family serine endoprotease [Pseudomonadales bacterium]
MTRLMLHARTGASLLAVLLLFAPFVRADGLPDFTRLVEANSPAVVNISTERKEVVRRGPSRNRDMDEFFRRFFPPDQYPPRERESRSLGSGFIIDKDGYVLTNYHVVEEADSIKVRLSDRRELDAEVVGSDRRSDLALLRVKAEDLPVVKLGSSEKLKVGEWVLAIGSPFGFDYSVTAGIVSAKGRSLPTAQNENYVPFIQTDVAINPGNSGGPLFNLAGEVVGINSQIYSNSGGFMGVSFSIPIDVAMEVVNQLRDSGHVSRGWLGVVIQEVNRDLAESFGLDRPRGALVSKVLDDSPAAKGGLMEGDIITAFNGHAIERSAELPHYVGRVAAGAEAKLDVVRNGERKVIKLKVGELADESETGGPGAGEASQNAIGMSVESLDEAALEQLGIEHGVRVTGVAGVAEAAGIQPGDIILRLNNVVISSVKAFDEAVKNLPAGKSVPVLVQRNGSSVFLALRVPE